MTRSDLARCHAVSGHFDAVIGIVMRRKLKRARKKRMELKRTSERRNHGWVMRPCPQCPSCLAADVRVWNHFSIIPVTMTLTPNYPALPATFRTRLDSRGEPTTLMVDKPWSFPASEQAIPVRHYAGRMRLPVMSPFGVLWISHTHRPWSRQSGPAHFSATVHYRHNFAG